MFERFTDRARGVLAEAGQLAKELKSPAIRRHHLLIAIVNSAHEGSESVAAVLIDAGIDPGEFREELLESLQASETALPESGAKVPFTAEAKKALELSLREALSLGHNYIGREHLLLGVLRDPSDALAAVLAETGLSHKRARAVVARQSPPTRVAKRRGGYRLRNVRSMLPRQQTEGLNAALRRAFERAGGERKTNTGDLLVALLETPGTHFAAALASVQLPDVATVTAEVDRLRESHAPDGTEDALLIDEAGGVTIRDPRLADAIKNIVGEGTITPERIEEILRRLQG